MNPMQQQQMMQQQQQQQGMMMGDVMQNQQQPQYGGQATMSYGGPSDSQQVQRLLRPGPAPMGQMQQMHPQNAMMQQQGVQQQQQHPMQIQQGGQSQQQMQGQPMMQGRPMVMAQPQRLSAPNPSVEAFIQNSLSAEMRQKIMQQPPEHRQVLVMKLMRDMQQQQRQRMTAARPQQWAASGETMIGQQPAHQFGGGGPFTNQIITQNQGQQPTYPPHQRHPMAPGQQQQQIPGMPSQRMVYPSDVLANQPMSYPQVNNRPSQGGLNVPQTIQGHPLNAPQQVGNPYSNPAHPSPGEYPTLNAAYPSPSPVHPPSSGPSPGYQPADASPGYPPMPLMGGQKKMAEPSPMSNSNDAQPSSAEDMMYKEKIRELQIYMDELKRNLDQQQRGGNVSGAQNKVQKFIDILEGRSKVSYDVLLKCEDHLKKQAASRRQMESDTKTSVCQPFLDAVVYVVANKSNANSILKRTFEFAGQNLPVGKKICTPQMPNKNIKTDVKNEIKIEDDDSSDGNESSTKPEAEKVDEKRSDKNAVGVPLTIQREVASLEPKFRIVLDKSKSSLSVDEKMIHVLCNIEDSKLPLVPSLKIRIPLDYPMTNPKCNFEFDDYSGTPFFDDIKKNLNGKFSKLNGSYSITTLLTNWELCVRQACMV